jgi:hypothetical protein
MTTQTEYKKYRIYGIVGMVTLFLMGAIVGFILNGSDRINHSIMTQEQCERLSDKMWTAINNNRYEEIGQLNKIYSENCLGRNFEQSKPQQKMEENKMPETTCGKIEMLLTERLHPVDEQDAEAHINNARIYRDLVKRGCQENSEKYEVLAQQESQIADALKKGNVNMLTCAQIERVLIPELRCVDGYEICGNPDAHINNAKIYANLSERGCPQNSGKYKDLAKQELEIARALNDDNMEDRREATEIVETYKRLQMQQEAERMIEKAKKLTNPAIDFIIQLEKIIEED